MRQVAADERRLGVSAATFDDEADHGLRDPP